MYHISREKARVKEEKVESPFRQPYRAATSPRGGSSLEPPRVAAPVGAPFGGAGAKRLRGFVHAAAHFAHEKSRPHGAAFAVEIIPRRPGRLLPPLLWLLPQRLPALRLPLRRLRRGRLRLLPRSLRQRPLRLPRSLRRRR